VTPLARHLRRLIAVDGPIPVSRFMAEALGHPEHGYYMTRDPLGADGDFVTAPEVSQMFGELIGLWCAETWRAMGAPARVLLAELGPGRGTLMTDALRAAAVLPDFLAAVEVHLVETSPALRTCQRQRLGARVTAWHDHVDRLPVGPLLLIANEFFDALPIRQLQRTADGWHERLVSTGENDFSFVLAPEPLPCALLSAAAAAAPVGSTIELAPGREGMMAAIAERLAREGGAALVIDYGHGGTGTGDTLQAVRRHAFAKVLADPGSADLTAHVDFQALREAAGGAGARVYGPVPQGDFLLALGIDERAARLTAGAAPEVGARIRQARERLVSAEQMGRLFKVLAVTAPSLPVPAGFEAGE